MGLETAGEFQYPVWLRTIQKTMRIRRLIWPCCYTSATDHVVRLRQKSGCRRGQSGTEAHTEFQAAIDASGAQPGCKTTITVRTEDTEAGNTTLVVRTRQ
jgi:hypothetical protein